MISTGSNIHRSQIALPLRNSVVIFAAMHYVSVENLSKSFGIRTLFQNITLHIEEGDKIALVARNGSGKSTLMKIIAFRPSGVFTKILSKLEICFRETPMNKACLILGVPLYKSL